MRITTTIARLVAIALSPLLVASACGGGSSTPHTLAGSISCFRAHGVAVTGSIDASQEQDVDPDIRVIEDFIGYEGSLQGMFHGSLFIIEVYDSSVDMYTLGTREDLFAPLDGCFDTIAKYRE